MARGARPGPKTTPADRAPGKLSKKGLTSRRATAQLLKDKGLDEVFFKMNAALPPQYKSRTVGAPGGRAPRPPSHPRHTTHLAAPLPRWSHWRTT